MSRISKRYAQALLDIAVEKDSLDLYEEQLKDCIDIIGSSNIIREILSNPENDFAIKVKLLDKLFGKSVSTDIFNLFKLLVDKHRLNILLDLFTDYKSGKAELAKTLEVTAISAFPLEEDLINSIKTKLKSKYHVSQVNLIFQIDDSLLGGFKLIIGNEVIDKTVKGMMDAMKNQVISR